MLVGVQHGRLHRRFAGIHRPLANLWEPARRHSVNRPLAVHGCVAEEDGRGAMSVVCVQQYFTAHFFGGNTAVEDRLRCIKQNNATRQHPILFTAPSRMQHRQKDGRGHGFKASTILCMGPSRMRLSLTLVASCSCDRGSGKKY